MNLQNVPQRETPLNNNLWQMWFIAIRDAILGNSAGATSAITVGANPFVYQNNTKARMAVLVSGGTVSQVAFSRDGTTYYALGTQGQFVLNPLDYLKITYTVAPTVIGVPL